MSSSHEIMPFIMRCCPICIREEGAQKKQSIQERSDYRCLFAFDRVID